MKNVFLDTNILIDYVLNRPGEKVASDFTSVPDPSARRFS